MEQDLVILARQYSEIKKQREMVDAREKELKDKLRAAVVEYGETDEKGSRFLDIDDESSGIGRIINQKRVSKTFDPDAAESILSQKDLLDRCTVMVPVLDEEEILAVRYEELLTDDDIDAMFPAKETWAFVVK